MLSDVFNYIDKQSLDQPHHWKYPKKSQILQRFPQILHLLFISAVSYHRAEERASLNLVRGHVWVTCPAWCGLVKAGKDAIPIFGMLQTPSAKSCRSLRAAGLGKCDSNSANSSNLPCHISQASLAAAFQAWCNPGLNPVKAELCRAQA